MLFSDFFSDLRKLIILTFSLRKTSETFENFQQVSEKPKKLKWTSASSIIWEEKRKAEKEFKEELSSPKTQNF
jgi:hypothetical protein